MRISRLSSQGSGTPTPAAVDTAPEIGAGTSGTLCAVVSGIETCKFVDTEALPDGVAFVYFVNADFADSPPPSPNSNFAAITAPNDPPVVMLGTPSPAPNAAGWNNTAVTVSVGATDPSNVASFSCTDNGAPIAVSGPIGLGTPTASGTVTLSANGTRVLVCAATDGASPANTGAAVGSDNTRTVKIDITVPSTVITRANPSPNGAATVDFTVTFSEGVSGVDASDFALAQSPVGLGASIASVTGSGPYTVRVNTGAGNGMLGLNLVDNDSIVDVAGNNLGGTGAGNGNVTGPVYTISKTGIPAITATAVSHTSNYPAAGGTVTVRFTNTGAGNATNLKVNTVTLTRLSGSGTITYGGSPALPVHAERDGQPHGRELC